MLTTQEVTAVYLKKGIEDSALELEIVRIFAATRKEPMDLIRDYPLLWSLRHQLGEEVGEKTA